MDDSKKKLITRLGEAKNVLVTVSKNPSVDQLSALMGLALALDKSKKHTAAIFSGRVPSTLEFLQPEDTIQKTTDSLRDFIISLDRSKAAKLRYTAEEDVVKIFITPYRSSLTQADLSYGEGEYNVDLVIALGVKQQSDLDEALISHGSILHDATVATINLSNEAGLGTINWSEENASSLCELVTELIQAIDPSLIDGQIATSLLTGIVAETARFSNDKTSSHTMSASAALMTAGANQQLIATQLEQGDHEDNDTGPPAGEAMVASDGTLEIDHSSDQPATSDTPPAVPALPTPEAPTPPTPLAPSMPQPPMPPELSEPTAQVSPGARMITEPPTMGGQLTANTMAEGLEPSTDPLSAVTPPPSILPDANVSSQNPIGKTLSDLEKEVNSPHLQRDKTLIDIEKEVNSPHLSDFNADQGANFNQAPTGMGQPTDSISADVPSSQNPVFNANAAPPVPPPLPFNQDSPKQ